jgi:hypothetical protein
MIKTIKLSSKDKNDLRQIYLPNKPEQPSIVGMFIPPAKSNWCIIDKDTCGGKFIIKGLKEGIFTVKPTHTAFMPIKGNKPILGEVHQVDISKLPEQDKERNLLEGFPNLLAESPTLTASSSLNPILFVLDSSQQVKPDYEVEFSLLEQEVE